jgi:hypothetical protein
MAKDPRPQARAKEGVKDYGFGYDPDNLSADPGNPTPEPTANFPLAITGDTGGCDEVNYDLTPNDPDLPTLSGSAVISADGTTWTITVQSTDLVDDMEYTLDVIGYGKLKPQVLPARYLVEPSV